MMKWFLKQGRKIVKAIAFLLILWGVGFAAAWYFYIYPRVRRLDPAWQMFGYGKFLWEARERDIIRYGWMHDDGFDVGAHGDKRWVERIIVGLSEGGLLDGCWGGHKELALRRLTCQDPTGGKNCGGETEWIQWWEENREKSQVKWIRDGLAKCGAEVDTPASEDDYIPLLTILGAPVPEYPDLLDPDMPDSMPSYVKYNAYRWLRDSRFDPIAFSLSCDADSTPEVVREGLSEYYQRISDNDRNLSAGILPIHEDYEEYEEADALDCRAYIFTTECQLIFHGLMIVPFLLGVGLLLFVRRKKKRDSPADASPRSAEN